MQTHREGMAHHSNLLSGQGAQLGLKTLHVRLLQQLRSEYALVTNVQILFAPIPNLSAGYLPLSRARADGCFTRLTFQLAAHGEQVCIRSRQVELAHVHGQSESDVEAVLFLQSVAIAFNLEHCLI